MKNEKYKIIVPGDADERRDLQAEKIKVKNKSEGLDLVEVVHGANDRDKLALDLDITNSALASFSEAESSIYIGRWGKTKIIFEKS